MNPYAIEPPWVVSFSGGRTSGFMLRMMLDASGGKLPDGCVVAFANTGREHPATLDFVEECSRRWSIPIVWLERLYKQDPGFRIVDRSTASMNGEPFSMLIAGKNYLPNPVARFCTEELKVKCIAMYLKSIGITDSTMAIGLRADEPRRVHRVHGDIRNGFECSCPIARAGHTLEDVLAFWKAQPFDLMLPNNDKAWGNCDLCFLKSRGLIDRVMQSDPSRTSWWIEEEKRIGATFRRDRPSYSQMLVQVRIQGELFTPEEDDGSSIACTCTD